MRALEIRPKVGLEWRVSEVSAMWVMAGREITEDEPRMSEGDALTFKMRVAVLVYFGVLQLLCCLLGVIWCVLLKYFITIIIPSVHAVLVLLIFAVTHVANKRRWTTQKDAVDKAAFCLSAICIVAAPLFWRLRTAMQGWHWSTGASLWKWGASMGAVLLYEHPIKYGTIAFLAGVVQDVVVMVACRAFVTEPVEDDTGFVFTMVSVAVSYALFPVFMALLFRRQSHNHLVRLEAVTAQQLRLEAYRASSRFLIFSLIPPVKATKLHHASPSQWHRGGHDEYQDCSLVQMDVSGFTALSSRVGSEELVDFINAVFTSVEYAAECIGKAWMVELIGDCAKFIIGGPYECSDHAYRACVLGASIVEVCQRVARRLHIDLSVRVGIHTGRVSAAVTASRMPRYLIYGRDTHVVECLEAAAGRNQVLASAATAEALGGRWPLREAHEIALTDGSHVKAWAGGTALEEEGAMRDARALFPALHDLLAQFACDPRYLVE